jgi:hypothetical protein
MLGSNDAGAFALSMVVEHYLRTPLSAPELLISNTQVPRSTRVSDKLYGCRYCTSSM